MSNISTDGLRRSAFPTSWLGSLDGDVSRRLTHAFEEIILDSLYFGLNDKARTVLSKDTEQVVVCQLGSEEPPSSAEAEALATMPEYRALIGLADQYAELRMHLGEYAQLADPELLRNPTALRQLVKYLFQDDLGRDFLTNSALYGMVLSNVVYRSFPDKTLPARLCTRAKALSKALNRKLFLDNPVERHLHAARQQLDRLEPTSEESLLAALRELQQSLKTVERDLARSELQWIFVALPEPEPAATLSVQTMTDKLPQFGRQVQDLLAALARLPEANFGLAEELRGEWPQSAVNLRRRVAAYQTTPGYVLLAPGEDADKAAVSLSEPAANLRRALEALFALEYVSSPVTSAVPLQESPRDAAYSVLWREDLLRQATHLATAYQEFVRDQLDDLPDRVREPVHRLVRERLAHWMYGLAAQARSVVRLSSLETEEEKPIAEQAARMRQAVEPLRLFLTAYDRLAQEDGRLGADQDMVRLRSVVENDALQLLKRVDGRFLKENPYGVADHLLYWQGSSSPAFAAFSVDGVAALADYLSKQRERLRHWVHDFGEAPVLLLGMVNDMMRCQDSSEPLAARWLCMVEDLAQYDMMVPGNRLKELESYVTTTLPQVTVSNCAEVLQPHPDKSGSYVSLRRRDLEIAVHRRCLNLASQSHKAAYKQLARRFNHDLKGHFPFSLPNDVTARDAEPQLVFGFLVDFAAFQKSVDLSQANGNGAPNDPDWAPLQPFMNRMGEVHRFLSPLLPAKTGEPGSYQLGARFRADASQEHNPDQIADLTLAVGGKPLVGRATWRPGDEIQLTFYSAKDSLYQPKNADLDHNFTYRWSGAWALLRLLRWRPSPPAGNTADGSASAAGSSTTTLSFPIQLEFKDERERRRHRLLLFDLYQRADPSHKLVEDELTKTSVELEVGTTQERTPLVVPDSWPDFAPLFASDAAVAPPKGARP